MDLRTKREQTRGRDKRLRVNEPLDFQTDFHALQAPIESLPNELLAEIFEAGVLISKGQPHKFPFPCAISSVNRQWRAVAISTPRLWSTIIFHGEEDDDEFNRQLYCLDLWIERSASCLLDITITTAARTNYGRAIKRIIPHIGRWCQMTLKDIPGSIIESILAPLHAGFAPRLQSFDLSVSKNDGDYEYDLTYHGRMFTGGVPALTSLRIVGLHPTPVPRFVGLTALHFGGTLRPTGSVSLSHEELRDMLTASPSLANLTLEALIIRPMSNTNVADIQMSSLRTLSLNFAYCDDYFVQILILLSMPILENLSLAHMTRWHVYRFTKLCETSIPRYASLKTLKFFKFDDFYSHFTEFFFSTFSSTTHLYLISTPNSILEPTELLPAKCCRWPNLRAVTISPNVIPEIIQSRKARAHPITTAYIPRDSLVSDEASWARIRDELGVEVLEVDSFSDALQYPGGLEEIIYEDEDQYNSDESEYDNDDGERDRRHFYEHSYGVDYDDDPDGPGSDVLEYWAVCSSD